MTQDRRPARIVGSLAALVVLFVVVPAALVAVSRSRFGTWHPFGGVSTTDSGAIGDTLREPLADDAIADVIIRGCLIVAWVALAVIAVSIVAETVHMIRHRGLPTPHVRGLGWAQGIARYVAIGLVALLPVSATSGRAVAQSPTTLEAAMSAHDGDGPSVSALDDGLPAIELPIDRSGSTQSRQVREPPGELPAHVRERESTEATHVVRRGESIWQIASRLSGGDEQRTMDIADAILDENLGRTMADGATFVNPALIQPGWELIIPAEFVGAARPPTDAAPPEQGRADHGTADAVEPVAQTYVVVEGDTLTGIAESELGAASAWTTIWEANRGRDMGGGRTFEDPDLILPGWELNLDAAGAAAADDGAAEVVAVPDRADDAVPTPSKDAEDGTDDQLADDTPADGEAPADVIAPAEIDAPAHSDVPADDVPAAADVPADIQPVDALPVVPAPATTTTSSVPLAAGGGDAAAEPAVEAAPAAPSPIRLEHAALLAAGVLSLVALRRRRRLRAAMPRARIPAPPDEVAATERRLRTIEPSERAARIDVAVRAAAHHLAGDGAQVGLVLADRDGTITLHLTANATLPGPWTGTDAEWSLPGGVPIEMLAEDARQVGNPCLALIQVAVDEHDREVLVELEAAGITTVEARPEHADDIVRACAASLATSLAAEVAHLVSVALRPDTFLGHRNAHRAASVNEAVKLARQLVGATITSERTSFDLRARRTGGEMWEPAVMLFTSRDAAADRLADADLPAPGHGVATVVATERGALRNAGVRLVGYADRWELEAFGTMLRVTPIGLDPHDVADLNAVLVDADRAIEPTPLFADDVDAATEASDPAEPLTPIPHEIVVGLMGAVTVTDRAGNPGSFERSKTVELIAWLATHRERSTRTAARTALWELDVRDATFANVVSEARRGLARLVEPPHGDEWVARTLSESLPLHELVVTDAELIRQRLDHAQVAAPAHAIEVLRPAVEMIRDIPFAGTSYLWPDADGITSNLILLATTAAAELAAHALSIGDTELVFWATGHGLTVLPGHEELIGLRMRAHARAGDLAGVRQEWESYERVIVGDPWSDGEPAPKLLSLRRELLSPGP